MQGKPNNLITIFFSNNNLFVTGKKEDSFRIFKKIPLAE
jgi:hypothetical protein